MTVLDITVSLSEVLEVQGTPLQEPEIWATLCQSAELLQDLFLKGEAVSDVGPTFVIFPDTISLCSNGKIEFSDPSRTAVGHSPAAPETLGHMVMSDTAIEKIILEDFHEINMLTMKNICGSQKRKLKAAKTTQLQSVPKLTTFFKPKGD